VGAVDEEMMKAYIENQKWDEDDQGSPTEPWGGFSRSLDFPSQPESTGLSGSF
jgi:hypothetical protein